MSETRNPFDSIESAQEFLGLLAEAIREAQGDVASDRAGAAKAGEPRHVEALDLALYKLKLLDDHVERSLKILKDLRSVRRILVGEGVESEAEAGHE